MFNNYDYKIYREGIGKETIAFFEENLKNKYSKEYANKICEFHKAYCPSKKINEELYETLAELYENGYYLLAEGEYTIDSALDYFYNAMADDCHTDNDKQIFRELCDSSIAYYSTLLSVDCPELFVPYYYTYNFNVFERIAKEFDIELPQIPLQKDYKKRFFYYGEICKALCDFRIKHDMSPYELGAFLYEYAPNHIGGIDSYIEKELPEPRSAYFVGGKKDDIFLSDDKDTITFWQCNPDTMVGDMIVMYIKSPVSAITSVWQSVSVGFNDPFFYYYRCTYIANPQKIRKVTQKTLERDSIFKKLPIVRKNLQGINGVELYPSIYNHLLDMAKSDLPKINGADYTDNTDLKSEKDVENKIIKPFLNKLGYADNEYIQQLHIKVGNNREKFIPDFVINPVLSPGHQFADFVLEAKYSISKNSDLLETKVQVRNYSKLMSARYAVIASKDKIWIMSDDDDYEKEIISFTWEEVKNEDVFHKIYEMLGKK